jgi:impB/mucB/samB family C-terminal domain
MCIVWCFSMLRTTHCNRDASPVVPSQRAKSISDEDSYKRGTITQQQQVQQQLERLTPAVLQRAAQRLQQHSEAATTLRLGVRHRAAESRKTRQCRLPLQLLLLTTGTAEQQRAAMAGVQTLLWGLFDKLSLRAPYDISLISVGFADFQHAAVRQQSSNASANSSSGDGAAAGGFSTSTQSAMSKFLCKSPAPDNTVTNNTGNSCGSGTTSTAVGAAAGAAKTQSSTTATTAAATAEAAAASQERWDERMAIVTIAANCVRNCRDCGARVAVDDLQAHAQWHAGA